MVTAAPSGAPRWRAPALAGTVIVLGTAALAVVDPTTTHVPLCPLQFLTGLDCPGCGSLRAVHALTHLDVAAAADHNVVFTAAVPFLVLGWLAWLAAALGAGDRLPDLRRHPRVLGLVATVVLVAFTIARNLPRFAWLGSSA